MNVFLAYQKELSGLSNWPYCSYTNISSIYIENSCHRSRASYGMLKGGKTSTYTQFINIIYDFIFNLVKFFQGGNLFVSTWILSRGMEFIIPSSNGVHIIYFISWKMLNRVWKWRSYTTADYEHCTFQIYFKSQ